MNLKVIPFLVLFLSFTIGMGQNQLSKEILKKLDSIAVQDVSKKAPGIATAVIQDGKIIFKKTAGYANLKDSIRIQNNTRFNLASNGKQFTA